ncbi:MAG: YMGG-like glycine zipper-containing protein [Ferruginibacter sp.]
MKQTLIVFAISTLFFACKNKNNGLATDKNVVLTDTSLLRRSGILSDTAHSANFGAPAGSTTTSSTTTTVTTTTTTGNKVTTPKTVAKPVTHHTSSSTTASNSSAQTNNSSTIAADPVKKDAKFSDAAKATAIGAGTGAIIGAVVSKNKVQGAVVGGIVGGGTGYAIGRARDVKSGRVARKKAE